MFLINAKLKFELENSLPGRRVNSLCRRRGRLREPLDLVLRLLVPDLRLEEEAHVLRVRVEVGVGGEGVVADALQAIPIV